MFVQLHALTSYPSTLLNRDDAGFAKRIEFGGASRTRVSSQCLKRHWRTHQGEHALAELDVPETVRSRYTFEHLIARPLTGPGRPRPVVREITRLMMDLVLGSKTKSTELKTGQIVVLGRPEVDYLHAQIERVLEELATSHPEVLEAHAEHTDPVPGPEPIEPSKDERRTLEAIFEEVFDSEARQNLRGLGLGSGLSATLFGRMATGDLLARQDAALHVAHAMTVHAEQSENDYFSAVDELAAQLEERGSGHINDAELTSGLYYLYVVIDVPLLVSNLTGCPRAQWAEADSTLARAIIERMIHLLATVSPGAKLGSTAPYAHAECVLAEVGTAQPRTLANAFIRPVRCEPDLISETYQALATYLASHRKMYGVRGQNRLAAMGDSHPLERALELEPIALEELARWAATCAFAQET